MTKNFYKQSPSNDNSKLIRCLDKFLEIITKQENGSLTNLLRCFKLQSNTTISQKNVFVSLYLGNAYLDDIT